jgi:predicted MFS family arabinose efflux permease
LKQFVWRDRQLMLLLAAGSLVPMAGAVIAPILPGIVQDLQLDRTVAGYLVSTHYLTVALFSPLIGLLADRLGQVRVLGASLVFYGFSGIMGGFTHSFVPMLMTRCGVGAATGGIAAASLGLLAQKYPAGSERIQAIAYASSTLTLANIVYPLLAGWLGGFHWRLAFSLYGLALGMASAIPWMLVEPQNQELGGTSKPDVNIGQLGRVWQTSRTLPLLAVLCLTSAIAYTVIIYLPLHLKATLNAGSIAIGLTLTCEAIGAASISALGLQRIAQRAGLFGASSLGLAIMAIALMLMPQSFSLTTVQLIAFFFGIGLGIAVPGLYNILSHLSPPDVQSSILAIGTGATFLGQFLSPTVFGIVLAQGQGELSLVFYGAALLSLFIAFSLLGMFRWVSSSAS